MSLELGLVPLGRRAGGMVSAMGAAGVVGGSGGGLRRLRSRSSALKVALGRPVAGAEAEFALLWSAVPWEWHRSPTPVPGGRAAQGQASPAT